MNWTLNFLLVLEYRTYINDALKTIMVSPEGEWVCIYSAITNVIAEYIVYKIQYRLYDR